MAFEYNREALVYATQLGFIACRWPVFKHPALAIFNAVNITRPNSPAGIIGETMVYLNCDNDPEGAVAFLKKRNISGSSGPLVCRAFLGLCLYLAKHSSESKQVLQEMVDNKDSDDIDADTDATDLANKLLGELGGK